MTENIFESALGIAAHGADLDANESIGIGISPDFIKGTAPHLPDARITYGAFHVIVYAPTVMGKTQRIKQKTDPDLKGLRWAPLKNPQQSRPFTTPT